MTDCEMSAQVQEDGAAGTSEQAAQQGMEGPNTLLKAVRANDIDAVKAEIKHCLATRRKPMVSQVLIHFGS